MDNSTMRAQLRKVSGEHSRFLLSPFSLRHAASHGLVSWVRCALAVMLMCGAAVEEAAAQTNFFWTNSVNGNWNVAGNWTNDVPAGSVAPSTGGNINYGIFIQTNASPRLYMTVDNSLLSDSKFTLNQLVLNAAGTTGTNYITNSSAGTYFVFSTNSSGGLPQLLQNGNTVTRFHMGVILTNDLTLGGTGSGSLYFDRDVIGTNSLTQAGGYTTVLRTNNTFSGLLTIQAGAVQLEHSNALQNVPFIDVQNGGTLILNTAGVYTNALNIVGTGAGQGALRFAVSSIRWSGPIALQGNASIGIYRNGGATITNSGVISGAGNLTFYARGTSIANQDILILEATNTYTGTTTIQSASQGETFTVRLAGHNLLPTSTVLILNNNTTNAARFDLNAKDQAIAGLSTSGTGGSNVVFNTAAGLSRLTIANDANYTYGGQMASNILVIKSGTGVQTFSGTNIYSGGTLISNGVMRFENSYSLPSSGTITLASNTAAVAYNFAGGLATTLFPKIANITTTPGIIALTTNTSTAADTVNFSTYANLYLGAAETLTNATVYTPYQSGGVNYFNLGGGAVGAVLTFPSAIADADYGGSLSVVRIGGSATARSVVELTGANSYTGGTFLNGSTLSVGNNNNLGGASSAITFGGGVLRVTGATLTNLDSRTVNWSTFNGGFDIRDAGTVFTITNVVGGSSGFLKLGAGVLDLRGADTFSGDVTVQGGALRAEWGAGISLIANLVLTGGVWETASGLVNNNLGAGAGQVRLPGSTGGFSAITTPLTVNLGGAGATVQWGSAFFNPGVLMLNESSANQSLSFLNPLDFNGAVRTVAVNAVTATLAGGVTTSSGTAGLVKIGSGTLLLTNATPVVLGRSLTIREGTLTLGSDTATTLGGATATVDSNGVWNILGSVTVTTNVRVGTTVGARSVMTVGGNAVLLITNTASALQLGTVAGAAGAFYQTGGVVIISGASGSTGEGNFNPGVGGYGYYRITDGVLVNNGRFSFGGNSTTSISVFEQFGGVVTNKEWVIWRKGPAAVMNLMGGEFNANLSQGFTLNYDGTNYNVLNIAGATVNLAMANSLPLNLARQAASTGIVNLLSGTLTVNQIMATAPAQTYLNFDGGTLRVNPATTAALAGSFMTNALAGAYIYDGGATFVVESNIVTISQPLLGPTGKGVSSIVTNGLSASEISGYIGTPAVVISGGSGAGASAVAQIDLATGVLTNILVTSAGSGYLLGDTLTITLMGGGNTNVVLGNYTLSDNANTGNLTKSGDGAIFLLGANTYGGSTIINGGGLLLSNTSTSISAGALTMAGVTSAIGPTNILDQAFVDWVAGRMPGVVVTGAVLAAVNSANNLNFSGTMTNVFLGGLSNAVYTGGAVWADTTVRLGNGPGAFVYGSAIGDGTNLVIGPVGGNPLSIVVLTNVNTHASTWINSGILAVSNDFSLGTAGVGINFNGGGLAAFGTTNLVTGRALTFAADAVIGGSNATFTGTVNLGGVSRTLTITNPITSFEGTVSNGGLIKAGAGTLILTATNPYAGGTWLNAGILSVSNGSALGRGTITFNGGAIAGFGQPNVTVTQLVTFATNGFIATGSNLLFNKTVNLGGATRILSVSNTITTISSVVQNGGLTKAGPGTLILRGANTYAGGTFLSAGTLQINADAALGAVPGTAGTNITFTANSVLQFTNAMTLNANRSIGVASGVTQADFDMMGNTVTYAGDISGTGTGRFYYGTFVLAGTDSLPGTVVRNNTNTILVLSNLTGAAMLGNITVGNNSGVDDAWLYTAAPNQFGSNSVLSFNTASGANGRFHLLGNDQTIAGLSDTTTRGVIGNTHAETGYGDSTLTISNSAFYSYNGYMRDTLSGSGILSLAKDGPATQVVAGANITYTGPTTIRGGALYFSNTTALATPVITNNSQLGFVSTSGNAPVYAGVVTGSGVLIKEGAGVFQLTGNNNHTGDTLVRDGILQADFGAGFSAGSSLVLTGGTISTFSSSLTNAIGGAAGQIRFAAGTAGGFSAYNTPLTVNINNDGGMLVFGSANFNPSALILNNTVANNNLTFVNGLDLNGASRAIAVNATNMGLTATVSGVITNSGATANLRKIGPGVLALTGNNKFGGGLLVEDGMLRAEWGAGIPTTANLVLTGGVWETASGATAILGAGAGAMRLPGSTGGFSAITTPLTVNLDGFGGTIQWGGALFNPSVFLLNAATASATLDVVNILDLNGADRVFAINSGFDYPATISGVINNSSGTAGLIKAGPGLLILPDTTANTFNGNVTVRDGVLRAAWTAGLPATANLMLTGGVWETTSGSITASLGTGAGQVQLPGSTGGFSAVTLPMTINLGGANATVVWGSSTFNPTQLVLNASTANQPINFDNPIDFGNAAVRAIAVNASTVTLAQIVVSGTNTAGLTKTGSGMLILTNTTPVTLSRGVNVNGGTLWLTAGTTNNFTGASLVLNNESRLIMDGTVDLGANNILLGSVGASDRNVFQISTNLNANKIYLGNAAGAVGVVYQTGGVVNFTTVDGNNGEVSLGQGGADSYGYYALTNGVLNITAGRLSIGGANSSTNPKHGVFDMLGGTVNVKTYVFIVRSPGGAGVLNVFGGQFNAGDAQESSMNRGGVGYAVMNVGGLGQAALANFAIASNRAFQVVNDAGGTGIVNFLSGGTGIFNRIYSSVAGVGIVNFNGGTLQAREGSSQVYNGTNFMSGVTGYIYSGGATINTDTNNIIIGAPLLAPTDKGIASITTNGIPMDALSNYIGAPAIRITGGSGRGATAVAMIDPMTGVLTNIMVTSAGSGYLAGDTLTITLIGGGNTNVVLTTGNYSLADNTSGGLTKTGAGMLVLAGTNTYTGPTVVGAGTLQVGNGGITGTLDSGLIFGSYTFTNNGTLIYNRIDTNTAVNNITGSGGLVVLGSGSGQLNLAGTNDFSGGMAVTNGLLMFTHFGALPAAGSIALNSGVVGLNTNGVATWLLPRLAASPSGYIALGLTNASDAIDFSTFAGLGLASAEDVTYSGAFTPYTADGTNNWWLAAAGGSTFTFTNLITDGPNASPLRIGSNALPGLVGVVALRPQQANTYSGGTFLHGGVLNITNDNTLGVLPGSPVTNITFQTNATLQFGASMSLDVNRAISLASGTGTFDTLGNTVVIPGTVGGDGAVNKIGAGTLIFNNTNTARLLTVNAGTLVLSNTLFTASGINANGVVIVGDTALDTNATLVVDTGSVIVQPAGTNNAFTVGNFGSGNSLIVTNGGVIYAGTTNYPGFWVGNQAISSNNTATIVGVGSLIASPGRVVVGDDGSWNTMRVFDGGVVSNANWFEVGRVGTASNNLLLVSGNNALVTNSAQGIIIGEAGSGNSLIVTNSGRVATASRLVLGYNSTASNNSAYIGGLGSVLSAASHIQVGTGGTYNLMVVGNSASVTGAAVFVVGAASTANDNTAIITDTGTTVSIASEFRVGELGSRNAAMILTGATVNVAGYVQLGRQAGANDNRLIVSGENAWLNNTVNGLIVGNAGTGNVAIFTNQARVNGVRLVLGWSAAGNNNATYIGGTGTLLQIGAGGIWVGTNGSYNSLVIGNGAVVNNSNSVFSVGNGSSATVLSSNNQLVIDGGTWGGTNMNNDSYVGNFGVGNSLVITNGGVMDIASLSGNDFVIGSDAVSSNNSMFVAGNGSTFRFNQKIFVGNDGSSNRITVAAGGTINNNNGQWVVGDGASVSTVSSNNQLVIDGGSWVNTNMTADGIVGNYGVGNSFIIANGGSMRLGTATAGSVDFIIGNQSIASNNSMLVTGAGSVFSFTNTIYVGFSGSSNAMTVDAGGAVTNGSTFSVGGTGSGNLLMVTNGGKVNSVTFNLGESAGALNNVAIITGSGSILTNRGGASNQDFRVGNSGGSSSLRVLDGGAVGINRYLLIGYNSSSSNNSVLVSGTGSVLSAVLDVRVGSSGYSNRVTIANSGQVVGKQDFIVGYFTGTRSNLFVVTDPGSILTNTRNLFVGYYTGTFDNAMVITNGGQVIVGGYSTVGYGIGSGGLCTNNSVLVSGTGSFWRTAGLLTVGQFGEGNSLTVNDGGGVFASSIAVGSNGTFSTLSVSGGAVVTNAGLLQIGAVGGASNNIMTLSGANTRFYNAGETWIGATAAHHNVLQILDGAVMTNGSFFLLGRRSGADNNALIVNNASLLNGSSVLAVGGGAGIGNVAIFTNGAQVLAAEFNVGRGGGGTNNAAYIVGTGTVMQVTGVNGIQVGRGDAFNSLYISAGAAVTNAGILVVGVSAVTSNNLLQITGVGSRLWVGGDATLGESAVSLVEGNRMILDGGATAVLGGNLVISTNSVLRNLDGAVLQLAGHFDNLATNFAGNDFSGSFVFNGGTARTQQVEIASAYATDMIAANFMFGTFQVGDPLTTSNAYVRLVDQRANTAGVGNEILAASNLIVATAGSTLDLTNRTVFAFNMANAGTIQQAVAGGVARLDIVNTFTNQGNLYASAGGILQFSNAFINAGNGVIGLVGGTFTNFITGGVLTNLATIGGGGLVTTIIGNEPAGRIAATNTGLGGILTLSAGFTNGVSGPVNAGLLAALGSGAELRINQSFTNAGVIWMNNDSASVRLTDAGSNLVNAAGALIHGQGTLHAFLQNAGAVSNNTGGALNFSLAVENQAGGSIRAYNGSSIAFNGAVTNSGIIAASNGSLLQFNQGLTLAGSGSLALNPSTAIITGTLLLGSSGVVTMADSNDVLVLRGNFANGSTDTNNFNMRNGTMVFGGSTPLSGPGAFTNTFEVAGTNKGAIFAGFDKNMAVGTLNITNHIEFVNNINNGGGLGTNESLYVDVLHLFNGATLKLSQLTVYVGMQFIYEDGSGTKVLTGAPGDAITAANKDMFGLANVFLDAGGRIVFVPEPSAGALIGVGLAALAGARRRRRNVS